MTDAWCEDLLAFWFDELRPAQWFEKNAAVDDAIRQRFGPAFEAVSLTPPPTAALAGPREALAWLILLDQVPRNIFRGTARMFATDQSALSLAGDAVRRGFDQAVDAERRLFFYLPFEHSEKATDQDLSVELFEKLGDAEYLRYALAHRDIIARFGRFPHRNALLGRASSDEELAFLVQPGSGF